MLDSHCHLDRYPDASSIATKASRDGVFVIAVTNLPSHFEMGIPHVAKFSRVRLALGLHPLAADEHKAEWQHFERLLNKTSFVGEVGLDFSREGKATAKIQMESFRLVAKLLSNQPKFVTLHSRGAERDTLAVLKEFGVTPSVFHWYSGPLGVIDEALGDGHYFSVNTAMTESEKGRKIIARLPSDRVLTETDGPYVKINGKPVEPASVSIVEEFLSRAWNMPLSEARRTVWGNFRRLLTGLGLFKTV
jgi:TatD DNase family protein